VLGVNTLDVASENLRIYNRRLDTVLDYYDNNVLKIWASYKPFALQQQQNNSIRRERTKCCSIVAKEFPVV